MQVNYCAIIPPMEIYPDDLRRIMVLLETVLFPTNTIDQFLMQGVTNFIREKLVEYETQRQKDFLSMNAGTLTFSYGEGINTGTETNTEVTVAPDYPYPEGTAEKNRSKKKAKKRKAK